VCSLGRCQPVGAGPCTTILTLQVYSHVLEDADRQAAGALDQALTAGASSQPSSGVLIGGHLVGVYTDNQERLLAIRGAVVRFFA
jgi:hypothetical protein